jgi:HTH-type transcriptional regulator / antitoxin HipB
MEDKFNTTSHEELLDKHIGKQGTPQREEFEAELQADVIAYHLKQLRIKQQLTQQQLADLVGIDKTQISKIENGSRNLTIETITKIANALGAKVNFSINEN